MKAQTNKNLGARKQMKFSQEILAETKWLTRLITLGRYLKSELDNKSVPNRHWKVSLKYWYRTYIKFDTVCVVCAQEYIRLKWGQDWCQHDEGGTVKRQGAGWRMAESEYEGRSEALLDHDAKEWTESGQVQTKAQLQAMAHEHGWRDRGDDKLIESVAKRKGLR